MKNKKYYIVVISLFLFNVVYFIWQPYVKHILPLFGDCSKISDTFTNIIFFIAYFSFLIVITNSCFIKEQNNQILGKKFIFSLIVLIAIQILFDLIKFIINCLTDAYKVIGFDISNTVCFIITMFILFRFGNIPQKKSKKSKLILFFSVLVLFGFSAYLQIKNIYLLQLYKQKYISNSFILEKYRNNNVFSSQVISFFFECISSIVIYTILYVYYGVKKSKERLDSKAISKFILQIILIVALAAFSNVKVLFLPISFLGGFKEIDSDNSINLVDKNFYSEESYSAFFRLVAYDEKKSIYESGKIKFLYNNQEYLTTQSAYSAIFDGDYKNNKNNITKIQEFTIDGFDFQTYGDIAVMYLDEGKPRVIKTKDIIKQKQDNTLISVCEKLISDGNWSYFEYTAQYLLKYDREFIQPYIERYADGAFTNEEKNLPSNSDIQTEYIKNIAISLK